MVQLLPEAFDWRWPMILDGRELLQRPASHLLGVGLPSKTPQGLSLWLPRSRHARYLGQLTGHPSSQPAHAAGGQLYHCPRSRITASDMLPGFLQPWKPGNHPGGPLAVPLAVGAGNYGHCDVIRSHQPAQQVSPCVTSPTRISIPLPSPPSLLLLFNSVKWISVIFNQEPGG